ncbi:MAG: ribonuclease III [Planctomycetes bacterium]|nr:ribonuclease III [Planctomycetota bacterium]
MARVNPAIREARERSLLELSEKLGYRFKEIGLLDRALTHASMGNEGKKSYERLEFLGDAFLNFAVADVLFRQDTDVAEGRLTETRARIVSRQPLARAARRLDLQAHLLSGKGLREGERGSARILCDLMESVLGAVLIDGGVTPARAFVRRHILPKADSSAPTLEPEKDAKTALLHYCQHNKLGQPRYQLVDTVGLQHEQEFVVRAHVIDGRDARGTGRTKRAAEKQAAATLLERLRGQ